MCENVFNRDARKRSQGFVDVKSKTVGQLKELIHRQNKLLLNRSYLEKLPDKGKKILLFKADLEAELKRKEEECDATCELLWNLGLTEDLEWNKGKLSTSQTILDSDDDDDDDVDVDVDNDDMNRKVVVDPLKILATHSGTLGENKIKSNLIAKSSNRNGRTLHVSKLSEKCEESSKTSCKERFKPNQLKSNDKTLFKTSAENVRSRLGNKWEITQATPPPPLYKDAVMISLSESIKLQKEQAEKLKEIEKKNAAQKLFENMSVKIGDELPVHNISEYREGRKMFEKESEASDSDSENKDRSEFFVENGGWES